MNHDRMGFTALIAQPCGLYKVVLSQKQFRIYRRSIYMYIRIYVLYVLYTHIYIYRLRKWALANSPAFSVGFNLKFKNPEIRKRKNAQIKWIRILATTLSSSVLDTDRTLSRRFHCNVWYLRQFISMTHGTIYRRIDISSRPPSNIQFTGIVFEIIDPQLPLYYYYYLTN